MGKARQPERRTRFRVCVIRECTAGASRTVCTVSFIWRSNARRRETTEAQWRLNRVSAFIYNGKNATKLFILGDIFFVSLPPPQQVEPGSFSAALASLAHYLRDFDTFSSRVKGQRFRSGCGRFNVHLPCDVRGPVAEISAAPGSSSPQTRWSGGSR